MALNPVRRILLVHHHQHCCLGAVPCQPQRGYRREQIAEIRRSSLEERKSLNRRVYDKLGFHPPYLKKMEWIPYLEKKIEPTLNSEENPLYKKDPIFSFHSSCRLQEGVSQTLWLTKSVLMNEPMPKHLQEAATSIEIPNMEERVTASIRHCRQYDTEKKVIKKNRYIQNQVRSLLRLTNFLGPEMSLNRMTVEQHFVAGTWNREEDTIQVKGHPGLLVSSKTPLAVAASREEVEETRGLELPSFYPLAPTLDLLSTHIYQPNYHFAGYHKPHPFPYAHTRIIYNTRHWLTQHINASAVMFTFADGFSRAKQLYGADNTSDLEMPVVTQGIATDGVNFSFITVQINTLNMRENEGIKNMVWVDENNPLYEDMYPQDIYIQRARRQKNNRMMVRHLITKRDPEVGCQNLDISIFQKFLAYLGNQ